MKRPEKPPLRKTNPGDFNDPSIPMSHERLIGRLVTRWAKLEATLDDLIWQFLDLPLEFGRIITARMDASNKSKMIRALSEMVFDQLLNDYTRDLMDRVDFLKDERNFVVHGTWGRKNPEGVPIAMSLRSKDTPSTIIAESFDARRMRLLIRDMDAVKWRLLALFQSAQTWHRKARSQFQEYSSIPLPSPPDQSA
jgi:hypothetical protein